MSGRRAPVLGGINCPAGHGALRTVQSKRDGITVERLYCSDQAHDGRPASHPLGKADPTPAYFTMDDLEAATAAREAVPA